MLKHVHFQGIKSLLDVKVDLEPFTVQGFVDAILKFDDKPAP